MSVDPPGRADTTEQIRRKNLVGIPSVGPTRTSGLGSCKALGEESSMAVLRRPDGEIHYEEYGQGYPILLFAPGGMRSRAEMWHDPAGGPPRPWSDWTQSLAGSYRVIAMDQRNAGRSRTAIEANHGWDTYA